MHFSSTDSNDEPNFEKLSVDLGIPPWSQSQNQHTTITKCLCQQTIKYFANECKGSQMNQHSVQLL
jgi:hypothetical protein